MKKINPDQIVSVKAFPKKPHPDIEWQKGGRFLWFKWEPGFFEMGRRLSKEELAELVVDPDKSVYYRPYVDIKTTDGRWHEGFFENIDELNLFMERFKEWIKIS